ncbi:MAG: replication initiation protein RepC [Rhizobiaceae bacterium]|nr:replication initiation protein RepC [Rhizobiaceae bacterium]
MQSGHVTTPFGRRPMTLALVRRQVETAEAEGGPATDKWKVFRDACEARGFLGVQDRALAVLDALLTFYPRQELDSTRNMVVFPSNIQLSIRAHGIAGSTLRRHLSALVEAGLIIRRDSPNGKRYARRDRAGDIESAFGFDLSPLHARAGELAMLAQQVAEDRQHFRRLRESLTICRRDVRKLITAALEEGADGDWAAIETIYSALCARMPRNPRADQVSEILDEMELLRAEILNRLEMQLKTEKRDINDSDFGGHIQNSNPQHIHDLEPRSRTEQGAATAEEKQPKPAPIRNFPLGMVLRACPEIGPYGPDGTVGSWRDMMAAAVVVRSMLGVSPSAYQEACEVMGPENAAVAVACILERGGHINSPGGYLRDLTRKAARAEFSLGPMLMALLRARGEMASRTG